MNHSMIILLLLAGCFSMCLVAVLATRAVVLHRNRSRLRIRLEELIGSPRLATGKAALLSTQNLSVHSAHVGAPLYSYIETLLSRAALSFSPNEFLQFSFLLFLLPWICYLAFDPPIVLVAVSAFMLCIAPFALVRLRADRLREKFQTQLPDAIDLMVCVLKSGHSVPRSIRSVAEEMPPPCGTEFAEVFHRMNLGQTLPDALMRSVERFTSFELDMLRRACAIQIETGGSLSELLEKTNSTLRQRIKLRSHVSVLTAQSRLSAWIIGLMPLLIVIGFQAINPDYLKPLTDTNLGKLLLCGALFAMVAGIIIMRRLSLIRV